MKINNIFKSLQGESTFMGKPCIFVRFSGCNLIKRYGGCRFCDTRYAEEGKEIGLYNVMNKIEKLSQSTVNPNTFLKLVEITGGEPLLQEEELFELIDLLKLRGFTVLVETNGSLSIKQLITTPVHIIMDMKCPSSNMSKYNNLGNVDMLRLNMDELKFVIGDREDYDYAKNVLKTYPFDGEVLFSPVWGSMKFEDLAKWIIEDNLDVRMQIQMHKTIWGNRRGI